MAHSSVRDTRLRKMTTPYTSDMMEYPYSCIREDYLGYSVDTILQPIIVEEEKDRITADTFPHTIREHIWVREGEPDGEDWISCGVLASGVYFLYQASCDFTGFDCRGDMRLWLSRSWETIVNHAMDEKVYTLYIKGTQ
jgi:hypothetical protein